jgi:hypothetical protein
MSAPSRKRSNENAVAGPIYHADQSYIGPGLFPLPNAESSCKRARQVLTQLIANPYNFPSSTVRKHRLSEKLASICHSYWDEEVYFQRKPVGKEHHVGFRQFKEALEVVLSVIGNENLNRLNDPVRGYVWWTIRDELRSHAKELDVALPTIREHLARIAKLPEPKPLKRGRYERLHINNATARLCRMWASIGGDPIEKNPSVVPKRRPLEFVHLGPRFVHDILMAIDPTISPEYVRTGLRLAAKSNAPDENATEKR